MTDEDLLKWRDERHALLDSLPINMPFMTGHKVESKSIIGKSLKEISEFINELIDEYGEDAHLSVVTSAGEDEPDKIILWIVGFETDEEAEKRIKKMHDDIDRSYNNIAIINRWSNTTYANEIPSKDI